MKLLPVLLSIVVMSVPGAKALEFSGNPLPVIEIEADATSGLERIYVLHTKEGVKVSFVAGNGGVPQWKRFSAMGAAYAEPVAAVVDGPKATITLEAGDMGYLVEADGRQHCFWITDYSRHNLELNSLSPLPEQDCARLRLAFDGKAGEIPYYSINGRRMILGRGLELSYTTMTLDEESFSYVTTTAIETLDYISAETSIPAPLCDTRLQLSGDRFLKTWNREKEIETPSIEAIAVEATTRASQSQRENDNEQKESGAEGLGGSAPADITFEAAVTDGAIFRQWEISRTQEFEIPELTFSETEFTFSFQEQGTTYVRFRADNADGTCEFTGPVYEVFIGESKLEIPNAFSPKSTPGVNDLWKVSYKSLVSYQCNIFNRWGTQMFSSDNPADGWDGKYRGRFVPAGVYYYVIKARGADGVDYNRAGDINIIDYSEPSEQQTQQ